MQTVEQGGIVRAAAWSAYPWLIHGFAARAAGDFSGPLDDAAVTRIFGGGRATAAPRQVHANRAARTDCGWGAAPPEADAAVTDRAGVLVGVRTADCAPVLLVDPARKAVGAVHAGWRGAVAGVLENALDRMSAEFGSRPEDVEAAIGPAIGSCCFEVGPEVAALFDLEFVLPRAPRPHVDLPAFVRARLERRGLARVIGIAECTKCNVDRFFSHRGEGAGAGRALSAVGVR